MVDQCSRLPRYVLHEDNAAVGPHLASMSTDAAPTVIYGFSEKSKYDTYLKNCPGADTLTPYPIVKGYLQRQIANSVAALQLVVIDSASPDQPGLAAVTMQSIIAAMDGKQDSVTVSHALSRSGGTGYRVTEAQTELAYTT